MLLVGAVAIAVLVFGVVVVLNTMVYTTSIKPQASLSAAEETMTAEQVPRRDLKRFLRAYADGKPYLNQTNTAALETNLTRYSRRQAEFTAERAPATASVELNRTDSGQFALVKQSTDRNYEAEGGDNEWNLTDSGELTSVRFEFDAGTAASYPQSFTLTVRNASAGKWWRVKVWDLAGSPSTVRIETRNHDGDGGICDVDQSERVVLNETAITSPSTTCAIDFANDVPPNYSVRITKGQRLTGTYALGLTDPKESRFGEDETDQPYIDDLLVEAAFDFDYLTPRVSYESQVRIDVRSLLVPQVGGTAYLDREPGVSIRDNGSVVSYAVTDPEAREAYRSLVAPDSGALLLYDDFESGSVPANWSVVNGTGGVDDRAANTGAYALYHNSVDGRLERTSGVNTTGYDAVVVAYWAQEGLPSGSPDAGPEPGEGENMTVQYLDENGQWVTVDRALAVDGSLVRYDRRVYINASDARHDDFRVRFLTPADAGSDHWYVDDVRVRGRHER
jgi:hypothetical protein